MYYEIVIFFRFNLPIIESIGTFKTDGTTNNVFITPDVYSNR